MIDQVPPVQPQPSACEGRVREPGRPRPRLTSKSRWRLIVLQVLLLSLVVTLLGRLAYLQLTGTGRQGAAASAGLNSVIPAPRGVILDQVGRPLAGNRTATDVVADTRKLSDSPDGPASLAAVATMLGTDVVSLKRQVESATTRQVTIARDIKVADVMDLVENPQRYPGLALQTRSVRDLPGAEGARPAHVVGYVGQANAEEVKSDPGLSAASLVGRSGLEAQYDKDLRGTDGLRSPGGGDAAVATPAVPGDYLVTNIDAALQAVVEKQLAAAVSRARQSGLAADGGAAVVLDVTNGDVLAMASAPDFDPSQLNDGLTEAQYAKLTDPAAGKPLINRVTQGDLAPASTFKVISTTAAVLGGADLNGTYPCPSSYTVSGQTFRNYESEGFGDISLARALEVSCDTVFYRLAYDMWRRDGGSEPSGRTADLFLRTAEGFGLGRRTGVDLPGESTGRVVDRERKKSDYAELSAAYCRRAANGYPEVADPAQAELYRKYATEYCQDGARYRAGDAINFAVGQGDSLATPLQMATIYAAVANGGTLYEPHVAKAIVRPNGDVVRELAPKVNGTLPADARTIAYLQQALSGVPVNGTAHNVFSGFPLDQVPIAAKTGTAEVDGKQTTSWFASFAPANAPRYAVVFMVSQGGTGAGTSGPSVRAVYESLFGIDGSKVDPARSVLRGGAPARSLPRVGQDR